MDGSKKLIFLALLTVMGLLQLAASMSVVWAAGGIEVQVTPPASVIQSQPFNLTIKVYNRNTGSFEDWPPTPAPPFYFNKVAIGYILKDFTFIGPYEISVGDKAAYGATWSEINDKWNDPTPCEFDVSAVFPKNKLIPHGVMVPIVLSVYKDFFKFSSGKGSGSAAGATLVYAE